MATESKSTIGTASRDYATFALWEAGEDTNLISDNVYAVGEAYDDSVFSAGCLIDNWSTDSTHYIEITAAAGEEHSGIAGTGVRIVDTGATVVAAFNIRESYTRIYKMAIDTGSSANANFYGVYIQDTFIDAANDIRLSKLFINGESHSSGHGIEVYDGSAIVKIWDNIIMRCTSYAGIFISNCATAYVYNNTSYGNNYGIKRDAGTVISINNACFGNVTNQFSGTFSALSGYNASSANDCPGSNNQNSKTASDNFVSVGAGTEDFNVKDVNADIYYNGTDLSGDTNVPFFDDIVSYTRPVWDIGAFALQIGASSRALIVAQRLYSIHKFGLVSITAECKIRDLISDFGDKATFKIGNPSQTFSNCIVYNVKRSLVNPKRIIITAFTGGFQNNEDNAWS
jgi:hypothetical protein